MRRLPYSAEPPEEPVAPAAEGRLGGQQRGQRAPPPRRRRRERATTHVGFEVGKELAAAAAIAEGEQRAAGREVDGSSVILVRSDRLI